MPGLATATDLATYLGVPPEEMDEPRAEAFLEQASAFIRAYCGWHIAPSVTEALTVDGSGALMQPLPSGYLTSVGLVTAVGEAVADFTWSQAGYLVRSRPWPCVLRGVTAIVTHGYATTPPEVVAVVCMAATRAQTNPEGVTRKVAGPFQVQYSATASGSAGGLALLPNELLVLDRYRLAPRP